MPDMPGERVLPARSDEALRAVDDWLASLRGGARLLQAGELRGYDGRRAIAGWRLDVTFSDQIRRMDLLADRRFPRAPLRVVLVDRPAFLTWPHVEKDGVLCILPEIAQLTGSVTDAAAHVMDHACRLVDDSLAGTNEEDFRTEFCSYWDWDRSPGCAAMRSLLVPAPPTRPVRVWRGQVFYLIGEDEPSMSKWLRNLLGSDKPFTTEPAFLLWLDRPLLPREYPKSGADVIALARRTSREAAAEIEHMTSECPDALVIAIGADSPNGPCLATISVAPNIGLRSRSLRAGFRHNRIPERLVSQRYFGCNKVIRSSVQRIDPAWVHGRDQDPRFSKLRDSRVVILGCGSIGAPIACALAESGVGRLALTDPDQITWANIGRHPLGAESVGSNKAVALAKRLRTSYPHIDVEPYATCWEDLPGGLGAEITGDLIVSATGSWPSEAMLNEWHVMRGRSPFLVYGWTEPHGCAGHAVAITKTPSCLECGFDTAGIPLLRVSEWKTGTTLQEPACGAIFQPYGPIELVHIVALIAELAMDCLLGAISTSTHRVWANRRHRLTDLGGDWTPEWAKIAGDRLDGGFLHESIWPVSNSCSVCQIPSAA